MSARTLISGAVVLALFVAGCSKDPAPVPKADHDHDHAGHDHDHDHDHKDLKRFDLGKANAGSVEITATQLGLVAPGKEAMIEIKPSSALASGAIVRAWIGDSAAAGGKTVAGFHADDGDYDGHVKVPMPLPTGAKWWVEVEIPGSAAASVSFALKP